MKRKRKTKLGAIGVLVVLILVLAAAGFARPKGRGKAIHEVKELKGCTLAGIASAAMTEESTKVFYETLLGIPLLAYRASQTMPELLYELASGRTSAIVVPDVTASYLLATSEGKGLKRLDAPKDTAGGGEDGGRFSLGLALRKEQTELLYEMNAVLQDMKADGSLQDLLDQYVYAEQPKTMYYSATKGKGKKYVIGVTGTLPPIDRYDASEQPCGFSVALLAEFAKRTGDRFQIVKVTTEDSFTALASGKVDALFAFGTGKNTTPKEKDYVMTEGYCTVNEYAYLVLSEDK